MMRKLAIDILRKLGGLDDHGDLRRRVEHLQLQLDSEVATNDYLCQQLKLMDETVAMLREEIKRLKDTPLA